MIQSRFLSKTARAGVFWAYSVFLLLTKVQSLNAQQHYPEVRVRQANATGTSSWGGTARIDLDRDAFLVVLELGADGRARVLYPESPRDRGFLRSDHPLYVRLPSADAVFVQTSSVYTPVVIAFASDVAPDLSMFSGGRSRWDYQFAVPAGLSKAEAATKLAEMLYGSLDMPFSVAHTTIAPVLSISAQRLLASCGYSLFGSPSADYAQFLWDLYGPYPMGIGSIFTPVSSSSWFYGSGLSHFVPFPMYGFNRFTSGSLWNTFGASCDPMRTQSYYYVAVLGQRPVPVPPPSDTAYRAAPPADRTLGTGGVVDGVGLVADLPIGDFVRESAQVLLQKDDLANEVARLAESDSDGRRTISGPRGRDVAEGRSEKIDPSRGSSGGTGQGARDPASTPKQATGTTDRGRGSARATEVRGTTGGRSETGRPGSPAGRP